MVGALIRMCGDEDFETVFEIINEAAQAYRGIIPSDQWREPYMSEEDLRHVMDEGVLFWGYEEKGKLLGVMGIQPVLDVTLIRHAYVRTVRRNRGIGSKLLDALREKTLHPVLVGAWAAAVWAIRFYETHGFRLVAPEEKNRLLKQYWSIPERQVETSVVLADQRWLNRKRVSYAPSHDRGTSAHKDATGGIPIVSIVGRSNTGKTTLMVKLITELKRRGYRVATIKHNIHGFDIDHEGKDSWRHKKAGALVTVIASPHSVAVIEDVDRDYEISELRDRYIRDVDIILSEGFKGNPFPKIEVFRSVLKHEPLCTKEDNLIAVAGDRPLGRGVPCLDLDDVGGLVDLIEERFLAAPPIGGF
jgi:molybdopterin-guanine dinucleotide biosynthesis protein B